MKFQQTRRTHKDVVDAQTHLHRWMKYLIEKDPSIKREREEEFRKLSSLAMMGQEGEPFELRCSGDGVFRVARTLGGTIDKLINWSQQGDFLHINQGIKETDLDMKDAWKQVYERMIDCFPLAKELAVKMSAETPVKERPTSFTFDAKQEK